MNTYPRSGLQQRGQSGYVAFLFIFLVVPIILVPIALGHRGQGRHKPTTTSTGLEIITLSDGSQLYTFPKGRGGTFRGGSCRKSADLVRDEELQVKAKALNQLLLEFDWKDKLEAIAGTNPITLLIDAASFENCFDYQSGIADEDTMKRRRDYLDQIRMRAVDATVPKPDTSASQKKADGTAKADAKNTDKTNTETAATPTSDKKASKKSTDSKTKK